MFASTADAAGGLCRLYTGVHGDGGRALGHRGVRHRLRLQPLGGVGVVCAAGDLFRGRGAGVQRRGGVHLRLCDGAGDGGVDDPVLAGRTTIRRTGAATRAAARPRPTCTANTATPASPARARRTPAAVWRDKPPAATTTTRAPAPRAATTRGGSTTRTPAMRRAATTAPSTPRRVARATSARAGNYNTYTGQRSTPTRCRRRVRAAARYDRAGAATTGPEGNAHVGDGSTYNAKTGQSNTWGTATVGNNHYADVNGNVYKNTGSGWEQHSSTRLGRMHPAIIVGRQGIAGAQFRRRSMGRWRRRIRRRRDSVAAQRWRLRRIGGVDRFGGGGFGGGGFGGDRFGGGGFGGFRGGGRR